MTKTNRDSDVELAYKKAAHLFKKKYIYSRRQILNIVNTVYHTEGSIIPSDYCYNRINLDIADDFERRMHLFLYVRKNAYEYIGENFPYTGNIEHRDICVGRWENGQILYLDKDKIIHNSLNPRTTDELSFS